MLQYEYKSVYFVCRKPKTPLAIVPSTFENEINENGLHFPIDDEETNVKDFNSDVDDHEIETN